MNARYDITALGELLIDFTECGISPSGQRLFEQNPGGAPANLLAAAGKLGCRTAFIGKVGEDMHGRFLRDTLCAAGIDVSGLISDGGVFTTLAFVALGADGERSFSFARKPGADTCLTPDELPEDIIRGSAVFHIGSLSLTASPAREASMAALKIAKQAGCIISYDPNYRAPLWKSEAEASAAMRSVLPFADVIKLSDSETALLTGERDPAAAAAQLLSGGAALAAVTLGAQGAFIASCGCPQGVRVSGFAARATDTTGAGDCFWGAFLRRLVSEGAAPDRLGADALADYGRFACAAAALCVTRRGGIPSMPALSEISALLEGSSG